MAEIASDASFEGDPPSRMLHLEDIKEIANRAGFAADLSYGVSLRGDSSYQEDLKNSNPWEIGKRLARQIYQQEILGEGSISHRTLIEMAGISEKAITGGKRNSKDISFTVNIGQESSKILLKSKWVVNR